MLTVQSLHQAGNTSHQLIRSIALQTGNTKLEEFSVDKNTNVCLFRKIWLESPLSVEKFCRKNCRKISGVTHWKWSFSSVTVGGEERKEQDRVPMDPSLDCQITPDHILC